LAIDWLCKKQFGTQVAEQGLVMQLANKNQSD